MTPGRNFCKKIGVALLGLYIALMVSPSSAPADPPNPEKLPLPGLDGEIKSLRFYAGYYCDGHRIGYKKRKYQQQFVATETRCISWELVLAHPNPRADRVEFPVTAILLDSGGRTIDKSETWVRIETDDLLSQWGKNFNINDWPLDAYQVAVMIGGREYMRCSFTVVGK